MSNAEVKRITEPVIGWRLWDTEKYYNDGIRLYSFIKMNPWPFKLPMRTSDDSHGCTGKVFGKSFCDCGIHSFSTPEYLLEEILDYVAVYPSTWELFRTKPIVGKVKMWGTVDVHKKGYKSTHAYPVELYDAFGLLDPTSIMTLEENYGVPFKLGFENFKTEVERACKERMFTINPLVSINKIPFDYLNMTMAETFSTENGQNQYQTT